jgi:RNA polymerase sigma-70 factor (ECF subfamily)
MTAPVFRTAAAPDGASRKADPLAAAEFEAHALRHLGELAHFASWLTRDENDAADLVQDTLLKALRASGGFRPGTDMKAWLFTICRNTHRSHQRRNNRIEAVDSPALESLASVAVYRNAASIGLDAAFDHFDLRDAVRRELHRLPVSYREAVALVDLHDLAYDEAAYILDVPVGTVRSRLFRGRRLLQERLLVHARDAGILHADHAPLNTGRDR